MTFGRIALGLLLASIIAVLEVESQASVFGPGIFTDCVVLPKICPNDKITFYLYNRGLGNSSYRLIADDRANLMGAPMASNASLVVLIHGYTGDKDYSPNMELRPAFLAAGDYNVLSVDYSPLVKSPCYVQATMNIGTVASCTAQLLEAVYGAGLASKRNTHVVGFSLGAHVAGAVGSILSMPWVTGLDPALPLFDDYTSGRDSRLDPSDAEFVDVIHTNAGVKGKVVPVGHVDFYCNSATYQPGCNGNSSCDHVRAVEYYAESLTTRVGFYGAPCTLHKYQFLFGFGDVCYADFLNTPPFRLETMGAYVDHSARGTYQVLTNRESPFARGRNILAKADDDIRRALTI